MTARKHALRKLLSGEIDKRELESFEWDSEQELATLNVVDMARMLEGYLSSFVSQSEIEEWANLIEGRDDIGFEKENELVLREVLFEIANPELTKPLTLQSAKEALKKLGS